MFSLMFWDPDLFISSNKIEQCLCGAQSCAAGDRGYYSEGKEVVSLVWRVTLAGTFPDYSETEAEAALNGMCVFCHVGLWRVEEFSVFERLIAQFMC